jgi:arabinose-5-phosphate isomerase
VGIITDGDLRRHMRPDLLDLAVEDVMTARPICAKPDQLASETLQLLNAAKITAVFVIERGKPIGVIHLHDLLRAGVA